MKGGNCSPYIDEDAIQIVTVGRLSAEKHIEDVIYAMKKLISDNVLNLKWYIIGDGELYNDIKNKIHDLGLENYIFMLGKKTNPYPYMKKCDLYVQPSRYEGKAVTVTEAQILNKPVLITNYPTAKSQVKDGYDGLICELSVEGIARGIEGLFNNKNKLKILEDNCKSSDYSNSFELEKLYSLYR